MPTSAVMAGTPIPSTSVTPLIKWSNMPGTPSDSLTEPGRPMHRIGVDLGNHMLPNEPNGPQRLLLRHPHRQPEAELIGPRLLPPLALPQHLVRVPADQQLLL